MPATGDVPNTIKLLSELERSWSMFTATWKAVDLFAGMHIWQEQDRSDASSSAAASTSEPLNGMFLSTASAGLVAFIAATIGGGGLVVAVLLSAIVVFGTVWTMTGVRARRDVPCFKVLKPIDGTPSEVFLYLMNINNYAVWDASIERASVIHTIDDHSDIIHVVYRPVWIWPFWVAPRDVCLLRYWRRTEDGSYVICVQSTVHPECPPTHSIVRAKCNGGGFIIAPRNQVTAQPDELTSLVTHVVHLDPCGWEGQLFKRFNMVYAFLRPQVLALCGLQEVMEARKYVCPNISEEFATATAHAEEMAASMGGNPHGDNPNGTSGAGATNSSPLRELPTSVPRAMWAEPDSGAMLVRGPDYLTDRRKIPSAPPAFRLVGVDLFQSNKAIEHIAGRPDNIIQHELKRHEAEGTEMPFTFVINFVVPGSPRLNLVLYYQTPHPSVLHDGSPFAELMNDFLDGTDDFRNERFKLIPCIVEGSFIVRQAVGSTPAIIGKKLRQPYYRGRQYFELDVDIASSAVANRVVGLVTGYTKKLVIDMGFLIEGQRADELPERLFGSCRLVHIDLSVAKKID
ncbi:hypothetical protein PINS_up004584 [Pythium insidiosum]|nr:hypothetical protein PINS_up004584 [Pythium insidiosum]